MRRFREYGAILAISVASTFGASAEDVVVTLDQANQIARQAFINNNYAAANSLSYEVLQKRPDDAKALVMVAATDPQLGRAKQGREAGRRAFHLAKDPQLKFEAAFFTAAAAATEEKFTASKYWLRRAFQLAPNDAAKAQTSRQFKVLRQRDPLSVTLNFNISPSSNINNGTRETTDGQDPFGGGAGNFSADAQALSGLKFRVAAAFSYKLKESARARLSANFGVSADYYRLSSSSQADLDADPLSRISSAGDLSYETVYAGIRQQTIAEDQKSSLTYGFSLGQNWYGGSPLSYFASANITRAQALSPTRSLRYGLSAQRQFRLDDKDSSSNTVVVSASLNQRIAGSGALNFGGFIRDTNSNSTQIDNTALGLNLSYRFEKPVFAKTQLELSLGVQRAEYETNSFFGDRRDNRITASSTLIFSDINYFGFSPTATLTAQRTNSSVARFRTESLGINIGLRSSF